MFRVLKEWAARRLCVRFPLEQHVLCALPQHLAPQRRQLRLPFDYQAATYPFQDEDISVLDARGEPLPAVEGGVPAREALLRELPGRRAGAAAVLRAVVADLS
ncbi:hypothetical protein [Methylibium sp. Pch-M]|uniref:hypothetical protein n=1 Tax=Methylibium sp. Pch-M TaxID=2082386 RepID=UPI0013EC900B|nr:hypothetical protein [Methylibium sp. Pch-M]